MPTHSVIDPVIAYRPLDAASVVAFSLAFLAIAFASARKPSLGIAALIASIPFGFPHAIADTTITLDKVALLANGAGLVLGRRDPRALLRPAALAFVLCGTAVVLATLLSIVHATYHGAVLRETLKAAQYLAIFLVVTVAASADPDDRPLRVALTAVTLAVSVFAIAQEVVGAPSGLWFDNVPIPRIAGPLEGPNQLAGFLGILLAVVAAYALRRSRAPFEIATLAIGSAALVLTISRTGVLATLVGLAVVFAVSASAGRRPAIVAVAGGALAGCAGIAFWGYAAAHSILGLSLLDRFATLAEASSPGSVGTRSQLWSAAMILWREHPVFGIGAGNFERELGLAGYPQLHTHANSLYVQALVEGGIPLAVATLALVIVSILRFARGPFSEPMVAGAFGACIGFAGHQILDLLVFYPKVGETWWIVLALAAARVDAGAGERARERPRYGVRRS